MKILRQVFAFLAVLLLATPCFAGVPAIPPVPVNTATVSLAKGGIQVTNLAALKTLSPAQTPVVFTQGYYVANDGGAGEYHAVVGAKTILGQTGTAASVTAPPGLKLWQMKNVLSGTLTITADGGSSKTSGTINLSGAASFNAAATLLNAAFTSPGFTITWNGTAYVVTSNTTGSGSSIVVSSGSVATALGLTPSGFDTADDCGVIASNTGGYYSLAFSDTVTAKQCGAVGDNSHDDTANLAALFAFAQKKMVWASLDCDCVYRTTSALTITRPLMLQGGNSAIRPDVNLVTSGAGMYYVGGTNKAYSYKTEIRNLHLYGQQYSVNKIYNYCSDATLTTCHQADGLIITGDAQQVEGAVFDGLDIQGFRDNLTLSGANLYIMDFYNTKLGAAWRRGLAISLGSNAGEKITFTGGVIFNTINAAWTGVAIEDTGTLTKTDLYLNNLSIDYNDFNLKLMTTKAYLMNVHEENNSLNPTTVLTYVGGYERPGYIKFGGELETGPLGGTTFPGHTDTGKTAFISTGNGNFGHYEVMIYGTRMGIKVSSLISNGTDSIAGLEDIHAHFEYSPGFPPAVNYNTTLIFNGHFNTGAGGIQGFTKTNDAYSVFGYDSSTQTGPSRTMRLTSCACTLAGTASTAGYVRGSSNVTLAAVQAITSGTLTITADGGSSKTSSALNLSGAASFSAAAALIQAAFTSPGFTVTYDTISQGFLVTSNTTGVSSSISVSAGTVATALGLTVSNASTASATQDIGGVKAGDTILIRANTSVPVITGGSVVNKLYFYSSDGTLITTFILQNSLNGQNPFTTATNGFASAGGEYIAPKGTARTAYSFEASGFTGTAWVGNIDAWVN